MTPYQTPTLAVATLTACATYQRLLFSGIDAPDRALARSDDYRSFLMAGLEILRHGGPPALREVRTSIVAVVPGSDARHFDRLWDGLLTDGA